MRTVKKADIFLLSALLSVAAAIFLFGVIFQPKGNLVCVSVNGIEYGTYSLSEEKTVTIQTGDGYNILIIRNGTATVTEADCRDKICVAHPAVSRFGESIVCLPHGLVVEVVKK